MKTLSEMMRKARQSVLRRGVSVEDADDIVQEAFLRLERFSRDNEVRSPEAVLIRSAVHLSIDAARKARRSPMDYAAPLPETLAEDQPDAEQAWDAKQRLRHARAGIQRLPEKTRRCFIARRVDGLAYAEIATREQLTIRAVQERVARATLALMKWMEEC